MLERCNRILVFRALQLGDLLCATPAFRALRAAAPQAQITLVGLSSARSWAERYSDWFGFIDFPGYPGLPEANPDVRALPAFLGSIQAIEADLAIQMHGAGQITNPLVALFGARRLAGFTSLNSYTPDPDIFIQYPDGLPERRRLLALTEHLGAPGYDDLEFPFLPQDLADFMAIEESNRLAPGNYVCIHPGARSPGRRWPAERFARVADSLAAHGLTIVLTGTQQDASVVAEVAALMRAPAIDLCGRTSLGALAVVLRRAALLVSNDTGVAHLADALRVPSVVIFTGSDPQRWAPIDQERHKVVVDGWNATSVAVAGIARRLLAPREARIGA